MSRLKTAVKQFNSTFIQPPLFDPFPDYGFNLDPPPMFGQAGQIELGNTGLFISLEHGLCIDLPAILAPLAGVAVSLTNDRIAQSESPWLLVRLRQEMDRVAESLIMPSTEHFPLPVNANTFPMEDITVTTATPRVNAKNFWVPYNQTVIATVTLKAHGGPLVSDACIAEILGTNDPGVTVLSEAQATGMSFGPRVSLQFGVPPQVCVSFERFDTFTEQSEFEVSLPLERGWYVMSAGVAGSDSSICQVSVKTLSFEGAPPPGEKPRIPLIPDFNMLVPALFLGGVVATPFAVDRVVNNNNQNRVNRR